MKSFVQALRGQNSAPKLPLVISLIGWRSPVRGLHLLCRARPAGCTDALVPPGDECREKQGVCGRQPFQRHPLVERELETGAVEPAALDVIRG